MPAETGAEDEITPASEDDPEIVEDAAEEAANYLTTQAQADIAAIDALMSQYETNIDVQTFQSTALQIAQSQPISDPLADVSQTDANSEKQFKELSDKLDAILKKNAANQPSLVSNVLKWLGVGGMVLGPGVTGLVFELLSRFAHKQTGDGVPVLTDAQKQQFQNAVSAWGQISDTDYWTAVYNFAQTNNSTCADLVYFMQYTQEIFPLTAPYLWPQLADKVNLANQLFTAAQQDDNSALSVVQQLEPGLHDSQGTLLPRSMAASCAILALSELAGLSTSSVR